MTKRFKLDEVAKLDKVSKKLFQGDEEDEYDDYRGFTVFSSDDGHEDLYPELSKKIKRCGFWEFHTDYDNHCPARPYEFFYKFQLRNKRKKSGNDEIFTDDKRERDYHIDAYGVSATFEDGSIVTFRITPKEIWPQQLYGFTEEQLLFILNRNLDNDDSFKLSNETMNTHYEIYKQQN